MSRMFLLIENYPESKTREIFVLSFNFRCEGALYFLDSDYPTVRPERIFLSLGFETLLTCEMKIEPDKFQWKFYPTDDPFNPNAPVDLNNATFHFVPEEKYTKQRMRSALSLRVKSSTAGDYQCLAYYGASVTALVPARLTITTLRDFPRQEDVDLTVLVGNTVSWRCLPPESNPEPIIDYYRNDQFVTPFPRTQTKSLILPNVSVDHSGIYKCNATNTMDTVKSSTRFNLRVVRNAPHRAPFFVMEPRRMYTVVKDHSVFLECSAIGNPIPKVYWFKKNDRLPSDRIEMIPGGLNIVNITSSDDGTYICNHTNTYGTVSHEITVIYNEEPNVDCILNTTDVKQGENLDLDCIVSGTPEPRVAWFLNGFSVMNDSAIEAIGKKIYFKTVEKRHAGNLQLFAWNQVKSVYGSVTIRVIPLSTSIDLPVTPIHKHHRHKGGSTRKLPKHKMFSNIMIPPAKPTISRLSDESVTVRWSVPENNGLPIKFFKVQYKEIGPANSNDPHNRNKSSRWRTTNADIAPNVLAYDVTGLKPDHIYRFRIAAVYSNDDNKLSPNSDKFHLRRLDFDNKTPLPVPMILRTETVNATSVKVYWEFTKKENSSVDGFYISYMSASTAGDYIKATADGEEVREYVITHLQPDTIYDVKLQSFNSKFASDFSPIMNATTWINQSSLDTTTVTTPSSEKAGFSNLYVTIAGVVIGCAVLVSVIVFFDGRDKGSVDSHIQAEGNEYIEYGPKSKPRANGCALPSNRITITANPLAEAENKNQNMMEMPRLTAQNNNGPQDSPSGSSSRQDTATNSKEKIKKSKEKNKRAKMSSETVESGENYV
ncbi:hypothetical protein NQ317_002440 [Molorchus minor]|uniref:Interference hedgehog n=1 Tax=Molorchus minor TaxID=1323400 RepID=A0ABQ9J707_9CUCU|nr:hypothetical protein NQ317_002440 [Molorchus minor]